MPQDTVADQSVPVQKRLTRRAFGKSATGAAAALAGVAVLPSGARGAIEKPVLAGIGTGGKGRSDIEQSHQAGFEIGALVDIVDAEKMSSLEGRLKALAGTRTAFPKARFYTDYRQMLSDLGDRIDAVTVSTPDHHHFHASVLAMQAGKHVYCQKPLTHSIWEARMLAQVAADTGVKTQMGNQAHANDHLRRCVELIRAGLIGPVKEIHAWTNRPIWPQGFAAPPAAQPIPEGLDWQQWIGPAPAVEYSPLVAPFNWRGWWDYGTGALGDMACHIMDMGYWAVQPEAPVKVSAVQEGATELSPPINSRITWEFGPNQYTSQNGFRYFWYDGYIGAHFDREKWQLVKAGEEYNHPDPELLDGVDFQDVGSVVVGEHGKLFFNRGKNNWIVRTSNEVDGFEWPDQSIPRARNQNNYLEWLDAIEGRIPQCESGFHLAGPMTETILLGVLAQRVPDTTLEWDGPAMSVKNRPDLNQFIRREYREGWSSPV